VGSPVAQAAGLGAGCLFHRAGAGNLTGEAAETVGIEGFGNHQRDADEKKRRREGHRFSVHGAKGNL
jgi:hypothetical protein